MRATALRLCIRPPEHGPRETPLVGAILKQHNLKEGGEDLREELRPLSQVLCYGLQRWVVVVVVVGGNHVGRHNSCMRL